MPSLKKPSDRQRTWLNRLMQQGTEDSPYTLFRFFDEFEDEELLPEWVNVWEKYASIMKDAVPPAVYESMESRIQSISAIDEEINSLTINDRDQVCFILGAGASAPHPSGIPTVNHLLPELWHRARRLGRDEIDRLEDWCDSHNVNNIEDLLTATYIANFASKNAFITGLLDYYLFSKDATTPGDVPRFRQARVQRPRVDSSSIALLQDTLQILFGLLTGTMLPAEPNPGHDAIVDFVRRHSNSSIVTTNYDGCIDEALINSGEPINTSIDASSENAQGIDLIKIHGSINWSYCDSCHEAREFDLLKLKELYEEDTLSYPVIGICKRCQGQRRTLLIPPMGLKFIIFPNLIRLWDLARERIEKAKLIIVVGYSFSEADTYINKIIERSMTNNPKQKMTIFDTDAMLVTSLRDKYSARIDDFDEKRILRATGSSDETLRDLLPALLKSPGKKISQKKKAK